MFPDCIRILLFTAMINGLVHQSVTASIRIRAVYHAIIYMNEPCSILFQSSDCFYQNVIYYHTNLFSSLCCFSLFLDRLLSINPRSLYNSYQKVYSVIYIVFQILIPIAILYWVFYDSVYTGFVLMCNYPPANASVKFYTASVIRLYFLGFVFVVALYLYYKNRNREKLMVHNVYNTKSRYQSYESYLATKAVCVIILSQIICLVPTSLVPSVFNNLRSEIPPKVYHQVIAFMAGLTYSNFLVPIIIWFQTNQITKRRHLMINKLQQKETADEHFGSLKVMWKKEMDTFYE